MTSVEFYGLYHGMILLRPAIIENQETLKCCFILECNSALPILKFHRGLTQDFNIPLRTLTL